MYSRFLVRGKNGVACDIRQSWPILRPKKLLATRNDGHAKTLYREGVNGAVPAPS